jgi:hypothetical membrane protein
MAAVAGAAGPAAFIATWAALGAGRPGYSPVHDPISRLAAIGAPSRPAMTAGFAAFAVGVGVFVPTLRRRMPAAGVAAGVTAAASAGIALLPLGGVGGDGPHAAAAGVAYAALAATPLLGARSLQAAGRTGLARVSTVTAAFVAAALTASVVTPRGVGLAQRLGLTAGDAWIIAVAVATAFRSRARQRTVDAPAAVGAERAVR